MVSHALAAENSAPVISSIAVTSTGLVRNGGVASLKAYVSDPNGDSMTYTWTATDGTISGTSTTARWTAPATGAGTVTIKLVAKDSVGAEGSKEISVAYAENSAPVVSSIAITSTGTVRSGGVASLKAYVSDPNGDAMTYTWSATDGSISGTSTTARWTAPATGAGTVTIKLVAKDSVGAEGSKEISVAYAENSAPVVSSIAVTSSGTVRNGGVASIKAYVSDPNNDSMTYTWTATEGTISGTSTTARWTAPATGTGTVTIKLVAKDSVGAEGSKEISIAYAENSAPVVSSIVKTSTGEVRNGGIASLKAYVSDPNGDAMTYTWTATEGTISGTSTTARWTAPATGSGTVTIKLVAKDSVGAEGSKEISIAYAENSAPVVSSIAVTSTGTVRSGGVASLKAYVSDPNNDPMTYTWTATEGTISGTSTTARWTAPATGTGTVTIKLVAKDSVGAEGSKEISIAYAENSAPVVSTIAVTSTGIVRSGGVASLKAYVSDPNGDAMTYTWSATEGAISGTSTTARWTAPATGTGTVTIKLVAKDSVGAEGSKEISIAYAENSAPVVSSIAKTSTGEVRNGGIASLKAYVSDPNGDAMTYTWSATVGTISGTSTTARWTAPATGTGTATIKLVAKDSVGAEGSKEISIVYAENSAPVVSSIAKTSTGEVRNGGIATLKAYVSDPNGDSMTYTWTATVGTISGTSTTARWTAPTTGTGTATIKLVAKDSVGAEGSKEISIAYAENSAPVVSSIVKTSAGTVRNGGVASLKAYVSDPNGDSMTYTWTATDGTISGTSTTARWTAPATGTGTATIKLVAKDSVGAEGSKEISVAYAENSAPVVSSIVKTSAGTVRNGGIASLKAYVSDPNGDSMTYTWTATDGTISGTSTTARWTAPATGTGTATIKLVAKDSVGAEGSKEISIAYAENSAPVVSFISVNPTGTVKNKAIAALTAYASDANGDTLTYVWTATEGSIIGSGKTAKWTAPASGAGTVTVKVVAKDAPGAEGSKEVAISYGSTGNTAPVVNTLSYAPTGKAAPGEIKNLSAIASDPENDTLTYTWTATAGTVTGSGTTASWTAPATGSGSATIKVTAKDPSGLEGSKEVTIAYGPNSVPVISSLTFSPSGKALNGKSKNIHGIATDPDNDVLKYIWTATAGTIIGSGPTPDWTAPSTGAGKAVITLKVTDPSLAEATKTVEIDYGPDTEIPSVPTNVSISAYSPTAIYITWTASTDNVEVTGYRIFRNGSLYDTIGIDTEWSDTGLTPETQYCYEICAIDAAGNASANTGSQCDKTLVQAVFGRLNDTGRTTWANASTNYLTAPQADFPGQDADHGRDKTDNSDTDGDAGFSFTKISSTGEELPVVADQWSAVRDNVTGLMWEYKKNDGGLHDKDWTYTWYEPDNSKNGEDPGVINGGECGGIISSADTWYFVQAVNAENFCGYSDWRLPTLQELKSIVNLGGGRPCIESRFFNIIAQSTSATNDKYWSSSPYAGDSANAWSLSLYLGGDGTRVKSTACHVLLVRGGQ